jgi:NAD(P)H dehydrogenase (quinone)
MKIAVTAASGSLGSAIIKQLLKQMPKERIIGLARTPEKADNLDVEIRPGDYNNKPDLIKSLTGVDMVLLVSGMDPPDKRIIQHQNVINAAKNARVKKIVYTSIFGEVGDTSFSPIISSNRQTEEDIKNSSLQWVIGRNGLYIEPDIEYIENYQKEGKITNCAANGKCSYTTRDEIAFAYSKMLVEDEHNGNIYNLVGKAITQHQLTDYLNYAFGTDLFFESISVEEYTRQR